MVQTKKLFGRIKAAIVCAAMTATTLITPALSTSISNSKVSAAAPEIKTLPHTFIADGEEDGPRQGNVALTSEQKKATSFTLNFTTDCEEEATVAVYGFGTTVAPDYWANCKVTEKTSGAGPFSIKVDVPKDIQGKVTKLGVGVWYPKDGSKFTLESIDADGVADPGTKPGPTGPAVIPGTENNKCGDYTFTDNGDGTATIVATYSAQYKLDPSDGSSSEFDYVLTQGTDEEDYAPYLDENGNEQPEWHEGDVINSRKFKFLNFGIDDMENITFQSFQYTLQSDEYDMSSIQYGGGINVQKGCPADTETTKGKDGYWYNDVGDDVMEEFGDKFEITVHGGYEATGCGSYANVTWDVPKDVQPWIDFSNSNNAVGFQFWYGKDETKEGPETEEGWSFDYMPIPEIHLTNCIATYTRTMTVPYNTLINKKTSSSLKSGGSTEFDLSELKLGPRDRLSAIKFTFDNSSEFSKFITGMGISVEDEKVGSAMGVKKGWFQAGDITIINNGPKAEVMWVLPDVIRNGVYPDGNMLVGFWYGGKDADTFSSTTLSNIDYYVFRTQEKDLDILGPGGIKVPDEIQLTVGDTYPLDVNVPGAIFESSRPNVAEVDSSGVITAIGEGLSTVTVKTPEGQKKEITVIVRGEATTTTVATTPAPVTTTTVTNDPNKTINWDQVIWGDVNVDGSVTLADLIALGKYLISKDLFPLKNATARENANCKYDNAIDNLDSSMLIEYNLRKINMDALGPQDPEIRKKATWYQKNKK